MLSAVSVRFSRTHARPGERIEILETGRLGWAPGKPTGLRVYLIPVRFAGRFVTYTGSAPQGEPPAWARRHYAGELVADRRGIARLRFRIPRLAAGRWTTLVWTPWDAHFPSVSGDIPDGRDPDPKILRIRS